jgi:D-glycero-alpha-D-manno-heptose 1-phosphate guanylyltransferase
MKYIVLCGGFGTRLGELTKNVPKPLLNIAGRPFLTYILDGIILYNPSEIILAVGYKWEKIYDFIGCSWKGVKVSYSIENTPLGTGGAIKSAMLNGNISEAVVVNGDTYNDINYIDFTNRAKIIDCDILIALSEIANSSRFGVVTFDGDDRITSFSEKKESASKWINSGCYFIKYSILDKIVYTNFSFEDEILAKSVLKTKTYAYRNIGFFIDIGLPEDFVRAENIFKIANSS